MFHLSPRHDEVELVYPLWAICDGEHVTLVDTGFAAEVARERHVGDHRDAVALLGAIGIAPEAVETVVLSHLHYDHFGMPQRYPQARFAVQRADVAYFAGAGAAHPAAAIADRASVAQLPELERAGRVQLLDGDAEVAGLKLLHVGGHTPGSQLTLVPRPGSPVLLACDASHFRANCETATPTAIIHSYDAYQYGFTRIRAQAGARWFPGHDPAMLAQLEPVADSVWRVP